MSEDLTNELIAAVKNKDLALVQALLDQGADPEAYNPQEECP